MRHCAWLGTAGLAMLAAAGCNGLKSVTAEPQPVPVGVVVRLPAVESLESVAVAPTPVPADPPRRVEQAGYIAEEMGGDLQGDAQKAEGPLLVQREIAPVEIAPSVRFKQSGEAPGNTHEVVSAVTLQAPVPFEESGAAAGGVPPEVLPGAEEVPGERKLAIDLSTALVQAAGQNPQVGFAQERINEALASLQAAEVLWLPSLAGGVNWNRHDGAIQDVVGDVIDTSRRSLYTGFGASAVGAGSPAIPGLSARFHLADAIYQPEIADYAVSARQYAVTAATNDVMLATALAYLELLEAEQLRAIALETLANAQTLADLTSEFARTGQGPQSDADRAQVELALRRNEVERAEEQARVASARLIQQLSMDPNQILVPQEPSVAPIEMVDRDEPLQELLARGLASRPELAESRALVNQAVARLRREQYAPLIPSVLMGVSYGALTGGVGDAPGRHNDRLDMDLAAFWEVRNLGFGERAARGAAASRVQQSELEQMRLMDRMARELVESHAQMQARHRQIATSQAAIQAAVDSHERNVARIREGQGLPIETLQSIQALDQARRAYLRSVTSYNEAQFRLHWAMGWPSSY